jgi:adenine-specific DNA-methyltransferase
LKKSTTNKARTLRRAMTDAERILWKRLRNRQLVNRKFRRQHPLGPYVLDFYCPSKRLVIEIDGGQHYTPEGKTRDKTREKYLNQHDIEVIRYSDRDVLTKVDAVLQDILDKIKEW